MRRFLNSLVVLLTVAMLGCGSGGPPRLTLYPVKGKVSYKGKAVTKCTIALLSATPMPEKGGAGKGLDFSFSGQLNDSGEFQLSAPGGKSGAPAGKYKVVLFLSAEETMKAMMGGGGKKGLESATPFPRDYLSASTSKKEVEVKAEPNDLVIEL